MKSLPAHGKICSANEIRDSAALLDMHLTSVDFQRCRTAISMQTSVLFHGGPVAALRNPFPLILLLGLGCSALRGDVITAVSCVANAPGSSQRIDDSNRCSIGAGSALSASASIVSGPFVLLTVQATAPGFPVNAIGAAGTANFTYDFTVTGGNAGDLVPVFISTILTTKGTDGVHAFGFASISVQSSAALGDAAAACTAGSGCGGPESFAGTLHTRVRSGSTGNTINLFVEASAGGSAIDQAAFASADPFIFIDPSFPGANLYSVVLSPGVANGIASTVPEPGNLAVVTLGLAMLAFGRWKFASRSAL